MLSTWSQCEREWSVLAQCVCAHISLCLCVCVSPETRCPHASVRLSFSLCVWLSLCAYMCLLIFLAVCVCVPVSPGTRCHLFMYSRIPFMCVFLVLYSATQQFFFFLSFPLLLSPFFSVPPLSGLFPFKKSANEKDSVKGERGQRSDREGD